MMYRLLIKTHSVTGLKYLCVTTRSNYHEYRGSGIAWRKHLSEHGNHWTTQLVFESKNKAEFDKVCWQKSKELEVADSDAWANMIPERGGGEYLFDEEGNRMLKQQPMPQEEVERITKTSAWFECSVCGRKMTENAFAGYKWHRSCESNPAFKMIPIEIEYKGE